MNFYWTEATATWLYIIYYVLTNYQLIIFIKLKCNICSTPLTIKERDRDKS